MFYPILERYDVDKEKALAYGFVECDNGLCCQKTLPDTEFYVKFILADKKLEVNVFDSETDEEYLPFNVVDNISGYVMGVRAKVSRLMEDIKRQCFIKSNVKLQLMDYCSQKFGTIPEAPWQDMPAAFTFKTAKRNKWYALFMTIPYKSLGLSKFGEIDIMNIKLPLDKITNLIDKVHYYPAYHMNKKCWLTVVLQKDLPISFVQELIAESYTLVEK